VSANKVVNAPEERARKKERDLNLKVLQKVADHGDLGAVFTHHLQAKRAMELADKYKFMTRKMVVTSVVGTPRGNLVKQKWAFWLTEAGREYLAKGGL
jgi:hypothetical protein